VYDALNHRPGEGIISDLGGTGRIWHQSPPPSEGENYQVLEYGDGATVLEYEYDAELDPNYPDVLLIISEAELLDSIEDAEQSFDEYLEAYRFGLEIDGTDVEIQEAPDLFTWGDENFAGYFELDGNRMGNVLVIRKKKTVFAFLLAGRFFDKPKLLYDLFVPKINLAGEFNP
jgi:hypothetical protein